MASLPILHPLRPDRRAWCGEPDPFAQIRAPKINPYAVPTDMQLCPRCLAAARRAARDRR